MTKFMMYTFTTAILATSVSALNTRPLNNFDNHVNLITDIKHVLGAKSIYIIHDDVQENFTANVALLNLLKLFSAREIPSQAMHQSELYEKYNSTFSRNTRHLMVVLLQHQINIEHFANFTKIHLLSTHVWLVIFWDPSKKALLEFCETPKANRFHLNFDIRMLVKCYDDPIIREWHAMNPGDGKVLVEEVFEWKPNFGLIKKLKTNIFQRRHNFNGTPIKVLISTKEGVANVTGTDVQNHVDVVQRLMTEVLTYMNFSLTRIYTNSSYGFFNHSNGKWTGVLGTLSSGDVDICFAELAVSRERIDHFDFTWPLFWSPDILFIKKPDGSVQVKWNTYFKEFENKIWLSVVTIMLIGSIIITIIKTRASMTCGSKKNIFIENFLYIWGIFCKQGLPEFPASSSLTIAYVSLFFSAIVVSAAYSGSIISNLTSFSPSIPFTSLEEFVEHKTHELILMRNGHYEYFIRYHLITVQQSSDDPVLIEAAKLMKTHDELPRNNLIGFEQVCKDKVVHYTNKALQRKLASRIPCKLAEVPIVGNQFTALPLAKNNPLTPFVNYQIRRFQDFGLTSRIKKLYVDNYDDPPQPYNSVGIVEIIPLLTALTLGISISIVALLFECISRSLKCTFSNCTNKKLNVSE